MERFKAGEEITFAVYPATATPTLKSMKFLDSNGKEIESESGSDAGRVSYKLQRVVRQATVVVESYEKLSTWPVDLEVHTPLGF